MKGLVMKVTAEVNLSAGEWQLYTASMNCTKAAQALNKAASEALSCGDAHKAIAIFSKAQDEWSAYGTADSEPTWEFEAMYEKVYGEDN